MTSYFAMFLPVVEGGYSILFPDFPEITSEGDDLDDCIFMGNDALHMVLEDMEEKNETPPTPSSLEKCRAALARELKDSTGLDLTREPLLQLFPVRTAENTPITISVSTTKKDLDTIDRKAKSLGMTRSKFLVQSALARC